MGWLTQAYSEADSVDWARGAGADWDRGSRYEFVIMYALLAE